MDIVITMLPAGQHVRDVYLCNGCIFSRAKQGAVFIDCSTIDVETARAVIAEADKKGFLMLDAPVSGQEARLSIMVGGTAEQFEAAKPLFDLLGTATLCGAAGAGQTVKACNQIQVAMNFIGMAEALVLGTKAGVDPEIILKVLSAGYAQTRVMDVRGPRVLHGDYTPGFRARLHYKDLNIIREAAKAYGASLPGSALAHELFTAMMANGWGDLDHSAVVKVIELLSNCTLPVKE